MEIPVDPYSYERQLARQVTVSIPELLAGTNDLLEQPEVTLDMANTWATLYNLIDSDEMREEHTTGYELTRTLSTDNLVMRERVIGQVSSVLDAKVIAGEITLDEALGCIDDHITDGTLANLCKAKLARNHAVEVGWEKRHKQSLKVSKQAVSFAIKSKNPDEIFMCKQTEAASMVAVGDYGGALKKATILWLKYEADIQQGMHDLPISAPQKPLEIIRTCHQIMGNFNKAAETQDKLFALGYAMETGAEYLDAIRTRAIVTEAAAVLAGLMRAVNPYHTT